MTATGGQTPAEAPWDLSFLGVGALATAAATVVAVPVTGLAAGWSSGIGVLVGAVIVTAFFSVSGVVVAWAGKTADSFTLPAALLMFFVKALALFAILDRLPADGWLDRRALACAVVAGALLWSGVQLRYVWTRKLFYVPAPAPPRVPPPAPPSSRPEATSTTARPGGPPVHPESPTNSG